MIKEKEIEAVILIFIIILLLFLGEAHCEEKWEPYIWSTNDSEVVVVQATNEFGINYTYQCKAVMESSRVYRLVSPEINKIDLLKGNLTSFTANKYKINEHGLIQGN